MAKENENLESTEETVEEVVADKDAEQEKKKKRKASPSPVKKQRKKLNVLKLKRHVTLVNQAQVVASLEVLPL